MYNHMCIIIAICDVDELEILRIYDLLLVQLSEHGVTSAQIHAHLCTTTLSDE